LRDTDLLARYGGDEFIIILTNTDVEGAAIFCNRLRARLEHAMLTADDQTPIRLTASFGVARYSFGKESTEDMIRDADQHLYAAKAQGRNRVVMTSQSGKRLAIQRTDDRQQRVENIAENS
jgi:diguanylate cyclase (GGDEF)-like protein